MQNINLDLLKEVLTVCYNEHKPYIREFRLQNLKILVITKYSHTDFKLQILDKDKNILNEIKIKNPDECFEKIYELVNQ